MDGENADRSLDERFEEEQATKTPLDRRSVELAASNKEVTA
jgi:hypothetical protein